MIRKRVLWAWIAIGFVCLKTAVVLAQSTTVWPAHAVDNSLLGADGVRFADANGDNRPDIATGWEQSGLVRIYFNPGNEHVREKWKYVTVGSAPNVEDAVLVDLDGDGAKDVISSSEGKTMRVQVHWAPGPGKDYADSTLWKTEVFPATKGLFQWMFAEPFQVDGRHGVDLVLGGKKDNDTYPQPYIGWLKAPANPRNLAAWEWIPLAKVSWVMSILMSDVNGDQLPDIVYSDRKVIPRGCRWLENPGRDKTTGSWTNHSIGDTTQEVVFMDIADLDGDGRQDVMVATKEDQIHFIQKLSADGLQWKTHKINYPKDIGRGKAVTVADVDGDNRKDLVISCEGAGETRSGVVYLRYRNSVFDPDWQRNEISGTVGRKYDLIPAIDLDGDGDLDVISTEENNNSQGGKPGLGIVWYENPVRSPLKSGRKNP
ncbi:FG-GAP repeat domain-containing protein [Larkinella humicola]|uniref:VCBS repeat-containing protein n=1 Tax=Larkinella humicola TaxID=2607654 RepID=A0A5N1J2S6_9BACT|nr:VCBS repeat-containing protein [Larkinella humicola]KAA9341063.1 VCBS repeat-containing protein [Larkinella humicola]